MQLRVFRALWKRQNHFFRRRDLQLLRAGAWRGNAEMNMSRDVPVTHFHLRSSLPPACASGKSALSRLTFVNVPHCQACCSQGFVGCEPQ